MVLSYGALRSRANFHASLMVGRESDRSLNPSRWGMMYGSKEDLILNAMVGFHDLNDL